MKGSNLAKLFMAMILVIFTLFNFGCENVLVGVAHSQSSEIDTSVVPSSEYLLNSSPCSPKDFRDVRFIDQHCNAISGEPDWDVIFYLAKNNITRTVLRLNGDGKDSKNMTISQEASEWYVWGVQFYYENFEGRMTEVGEMAYEMSKCGNLLIHCRNGRHRSAAVWAYILRKDGMDVEDIITVVGWDKLTPRELKMYDRYIRWALGASLYHMKY